MPLALITDCEATTLSSDEKAFFERVQPFGFILFQRHCDNPNQLKALTAELRACVAHDAPIFIDQEGGRVARLKPPHWDLYPPAETFARLADIDTFTGDAACYLNARMIAGELMECGINADCAPLADLRFPETHDVIGDRAFGATPRQVVKLAKMQAWGLAAGGVLPVLKHIPGHGRATVDSHLDLPVVDATLRELEQTDFVPFRELNHLPFAMTAHVVYTALDSTLPATLSPTVVRYIREIIGFDGLIMSDDLSMKALKGDLKDLAAQTLDAGCDLVLHCNGTLRERMRVAEGCRAMPQERYDLYAKAKAAIAIEYEEINREQLRTERDTLLEHLEISL